MTKPNPNEWAFEFQQRAQHPPLMADFWCKALRDTYPKEINLDIDGLDYLMTSENKGYYRNHQREIILKRFFEKLEQDPKYINYILSTIKKRVLEFDSFMDSNTRDWSKFTEKVLSLIPWLYIPWYITEFNFFSDKVIYALQEHQEEIEKITDTNNAAMLLMFPNQEMGFQQEQALLYKLVKQKKQNIPLDIKKYMEDFSWIRTFILVPTKPLREEDVIEKINLAIKDKFDTTYEIQLDRKKENQLITEKIKKIIIENQQLNKYVKNAQEVAWILTWSVETIMKSFSKGISWYQEIAKKIGLSYEDWVYLTIDEVESSLKNLKSSVNKNEIEKRKLASVIYIKEGLSGLLSGKEAKYFIQNLKNKTEEMLSSNIIEVAGKPSCPGKVRGRAKICLSAGDSVKVKEGDVLITIMTTPDYVPAMKKASAIVTNEGGLLCHAAIISRELNKPCVIATKTATRILKDGDLVEVDANTGIVRKIS